MPLFASKNACHSFGLIIRTLYLFLKQVDADMYSIKIKRVLLHKSKPNHIDRFPKNHSPNLHHCPPKTRAGNRDCANARVTYRCAYIYLSRRSPRGPFEWVRRRRPMRDKLLGLGARVGLAREIDKIQKKNWQKKIRQIFFSNLFRKFVNKIRTINLLLEL